MTPQEIKARELVDEMSIQNYRYQPYAGANYLIEEIGFEAGKKCAKISVNEIIASIPTQTSTGELERVDAIMFWINVGQEIDKL
jgi:hypothetical protein